MSQIIKKWKLDEIMKTFGNFNNKQKQMEDFFIEVAHLDELEIKFDFIEYNGLFLYYYYNNVRLFDMTKKFKYFHINSLIWKSFSSKFNLDYNNAQSILSSMIEKYFNLSGYKTIIL